jgi:hypothetical protein
VYECKICCGVCVCVFICTLEYGNINIHSIILHMHTHSHTRTRTHSPKKVANGGSSTDEASRSSDGSVAR